MRLRVRSWLTWRHTTATGEVRAPEAAEDWLNGDDLALGRRVDLLAIADIDADVGDPVVGIGVRAGEEHQVARLELVLGHARGGVVLLLRRARQRDAKLSKHELDQAGAIQSTGRIGAAENVRHAQITPSHVDRPRCPTQIEPQRCEPRVQTHATGDVGRVRVSAAGKTSG